MPGAAQPAWQSKVDPAVLAAAVQGETDFLVMLSEQADLTLASSFPTKASRGQFVYQRLYETASRTQAPLLAALAGQGAKYRSFWIANLVWARGSQAALQAAARRPEVQRIYPNPRLYNPPLQPAQDQPSTIGQVEWNIQQIGAPPVWAAGFTGQGAVIAGQDTGYHWTHPALQGKYRGWDGASADHNYNWHDAVHQDDPHSQPGNPCGFDSPAPCDDNGHGTHTMGTMVGDDGLGNQIGVAPSARWIGCRNMEQGWGSPSTYIECFQWFVAPTDLNDQNPRPDLAPDGINNSWSCPSAEGCSWDSLLQVVDNVRMAGILVVVSAGNQGSACSSISDAPAEYGSAFVVGATNNLDQAASFSSRGPALHTGLLKPDLSAPGVNIRSSNKLGGYVSNSGTSMAAPHAVGVAALAISITPALRGQVEQLEQLLRSSAFALPSSEICGGLPVGSVPNNTFGWGRLDAYRLLILLRIAAGQIHYFPLISR